MATKKKQTFDRNAKVRKLARDKVGSVKGSRAIDPKDARRNPKHKKPILPEDPER